MKVAVNDLLSKEYLYDSDIGRFDAVANFSLLRFQQQETAYTKDRKI